MIPLPPLDDGRVAVGALPNALAAPLARLERLMAQARNTEERGPRERKV